jgi:hypothetical protein
MTEAIADDPFRPMRDNLKRKQMRMEALSMVSGTCLTGVAGMATVATTILTMSTPLIVAAAVCGVLGLLVGGVTGITAWRERVDVGIIREELNSSLTAYKLSEALHQHAPTLELAHNQAYPNQQREDGKTWLETVQGDSLSPAQSAHR